MAKLLLAVLVILPVQLSTAQYNLDAERYLELRETIPEHPGKDFLSFVRTFRNAETFPYLQNLVNPLQNYQLLNVTLPDRNDTIISEECASHYQKIADGFENGTDYALQMVDSVGKPPAGILKFNVFWMGFFKQCRDVIAVEADEELFRGKYCKSSLLAPIRYPITVGLCFPDSCSNSDAQAIVNLALLRLTDDGTSQNITSQNSTGIVSRSTSCIEDFPWTAEDIIALVICGILGLCIVVSTTYDVLTTARKKEQKKHSPDRDIELTKTEKIPNGTSEQYTKAEQIPNGTSEKHTDNNQNVANGSTVPEEEKPRFVATISLNESMSSMTSLENGHSQSSLSIAQSTVHLTPAKEEENKEKRQRKPRQPLSHRLLMTFSVLTNGQKLFNLRKNPAAMDCLNGIRALSIAWVILGHSYNFTAFYLDNLHDWGKMTRRWTFQVIVNAFFAVDTFFFISGLLVTFGTLKLLKKTKGRLNWAMFYVHRYLRLTPVYAFLLMIFCTLYLHMLDGPYNDVAETAGPAVGNCYNNWWANLIYVNNFVPDTRPEQCMGWTWYLANDMQFFFVSPIFLFALYKNRKVGYALLTKSLLSCMLANGIMAQKYDLPAGAVSTLETDPTVGKYVGYTYRRPYYRIAPYIVGMALGDILFHVKERTKPIKIPFIVNMVCWVVSVGVNLLLLYSQVDLYAERKQYEPTIGALYYATSKTGWAVSLAYMVFACVNGYGGPVNWFLSWSIWQPMARLSYGAYLIHPMIMYWYYTSAQTLLHSLDYNYVYYFLGNMCLSFTGAFIASIAVEAPFMRLENIAFGR